MRIHVSLCSPLIYLKIHRMHYVIGQREQLIETKAIYHLDGVRRIFGGVTCAKEKLLLASCVMRWCIHPRPRPSRVLSPHEKYSTTIAIAGKKKRIQK
jgi:hypothetical protein